MATNVQIDCVHKNDRNGFHDRITFVGGPNPPGTQPARWKLSVADAIRGIDEDKYKFWVSVGGNSVWVVVATSASGTRYLKTAADGDETNNLLSLPECP